MGAWMASVSARPCRDGNRPASWFCGPAGFGQSLREDFLAHGLPPDRFHQELSQMR